MSKFSIIPNGGGTARYSGCPTFTGTYMKPGMLEFREIAFPTPIDWAVGDYVEYTRTGHTYRLYGIPQVKKQARPSEYGGAFVYQGVQLFDDSKQLEICPFRDLVTGDNRIHFSTQPSISTFEAVDGIARRLQACLEDMYGSGSWVVRVATSEENPGIYPLVEEAREFTVSGVNLLEALNKVYEIWPDVGWVYAVESGVNTIIIGGGGVSSTSSFLYGKGNGLTSITRTVANADELANRIFPYGANRNMLPRWYNSQNIKDAESVDIQNLMLPVDAIASLNWAGWGKTEVDGDMLPDAAKAYVEDSASILRLGLRPATVYFDGSGEYPAIYPSIREATIGMVRAAIGDSTAKYYPSTAIYTDADARIDKLLSVPSGFDSGLAGADGKSSVDNESAVVSDTGNKVFPANSTAGYYHIFTKSFTLGASGDMELSVSALLNGYIECSFAHSVDLYIVTNRDLGTPQIYELQRDANNRWNLNADYTTAPPKFTGVAGDTITISVDINIFADASSSDRSIYFDIAGGCNAGIKHYRSRNFTVKVRQLGFDIQAQADLGDGKTIAMRSGKCQGRSFVINSVQYDSATDSWVLDCWRSEDESLSQWFPNTDYPVRGKEANYDGDEFVLLDIAMPDIYVQMAEQRLLQAARELLADTATERWQYVPEIDAKFMVENNRTIVAGQNMMLQDADVIGESAVSVLVDSLTINEGEAAIPTYKVTLRDRKRKTWTESESDTGSSSKSVANSSASQTAASQAARAESFFEAKQDPEDSNRQYIQLKEQYTGLASLGWMAAGGVGSGSGGGGIVDNVHPQDDLEGQPVTSEDLTETYSAYAIQSIYNAVKQLQQSTPNVSLVNGAGNSTLTVNGTVADFYTKGQIDAIVGAVYRPAGNASTVSELGSLTAANIGKVYNMTASFTTTADFVEGAGKTFPAGTNVVIVDAGSGTYKYDVLSGFVDLSGYAQKVSGATNGHFAGLDSNGNLTDSGHSHADYVTALGTSGNYLTWTKNGTTNNITVPYATVAGKIGTSTVGASNRPIYLNAGVPTVTNPGEAFLSWGGKNFSASYGPIDAAMVSELGACRTMFTKAAGITIEYSTDGGLTWLTYEATDEEKVGLFSSGKGFTIGHATAATASANNMLRVTLNSAYASIYTTFNKFVIFVSTNGSTGCYCTMRGRTRANYDADADVWTTFADAVPVAGWSGYNVINTGSITFGSNNDQIRQLQFIFGCTAHSSSSYAGLNVSKIFGFGGVGWTTPSNMAKTGHLYAYDALQNATFPAAIYANVNGSNLGSSTKRWNVFATQLTVGQANNNSSYIGSDTANNIWLHNSAGYALVADGTVIRRGYALTNATLGSSTYPWGGLYSTTGSFTGAVTLGSTLSVADAITLSGSTASARRIYFGDASHYLELDQYGFHFYGAGLYTDSWMAAGGIGEGGGGGDVSYLGDLSDVGITSPSAGDILVYDPTQPKPWVNLPQSSITPDLSAYALKVGGSDYEFKVSKLKFANSGHADSYLSVGAIIPGEQRPLWTYSHAALIQGQPDVVESVYLALYDDIPDELPNPYALTFGSKTYDGSAPKTITASDLGALTTETDPTVPSWAKQTSKPSYSLSEISGTSDLQAIEALTGTSGLLKKTAADTWALDTTNYLSSHQTIYALTLQAGTFSAGTYTPNSAAKTINIPTTLDHISDGTNVKYSDFVHITGAETITGAKTFSADLTLSENLVMGAAKHIDIGPVRIEYDSTNQALHVTTNQTGNNAPIIGLYADGFLAAGGIGTNGGGGGYGLEQITTNQDGTVDFHFTGGDVTTVDLNHEHPQYPKYVHLASESEMPASPDPYTMYIIDGSGGGGGGSYTLPAATSSALGRVKIGFSQTGKSYPVALDANDKAYVELPTAIVYLTSESQMPANPDSNTLYVILETTT